MSKTLCATLPAASPKSVAFSFAVCCAGMVSVAIACNLLPIFFTSLQSSLGGPDGLSNEELGRIAAVNFTGLCVAIVATGPLADRLGPRLFAVLGNVLLAIGLLLLGLSPDYALLLLAAFVMGLGAGMIDTVLSPIVGALKPERRASAMNWLHSYYCTGAVATVVVAAGALRMGISWRHISLALITIPVLILLAFLFVRLPPLVSESAPGGRQSVRSLLRVPLFWLALGSILLGGATEMGMAQWLPTYTEETLGLNKLTAGMALAGFSVAMAIGRIGVGVIGHRIDPVRWMIGCCVVTVLLFLIGAFWRQPHVALWACMLAGASGSCLWPSMLAVSADRFPRGGASMYGMLAAFGNLGGIAMPWIVGIAADQWTMRIGLGLTALCPLLMIPLLLPFNRPQPLHSIPPAIE